jgi:hypothetical protein
MYSSSLPSTELYHIENNHILNDEQRDVTLLIGILLLSLCSLGLAGWVAVQNKRLAQRLASALGGTSPESLETTLAGHIARVEEVNDRLANLEDEYSRLSVTGALASQKISVVRYNPFGDTGGDQSFCLAVLDAHDSGYVLSSIHGRQGTRVYVKPVDFGKSKYQLSAEEEKALSQAAKRVPKTN